MTTIERIGPDTLPEALELLLATRTRRADTQQVRSYRAYLDQGPLNWEGLQVLRSGRVRGVFFAMLLPGRSAIVMTAVPGQHGIESEDQLEALRRGLEQLEPRKLHYAQILVETPVPELRQLIEQAGLRHLARLHYLQRDASYPWADPPHKHEAEWLTFDERTYDEFARTLAKTYQDSLDCAELTGLRPIRDVIASHQATGRFEPHMWAVARVAGQSAAALLLAVVPQASAVEVVYMGVTPSFRRRGVGALLLRQALHKCRQARRRTLTLVVDARNTPARQLYERFAFQPLTTREAYLYRWGEGPWRSAATTPARE